MTFKGFEVIFDQVDAGGGAFSWLFHTTTIFDRDGVSCKKEAKLSSSSPKTINKTISHANQRIYIF